MLPHHYFARPRAALYSAIAAGVLALPAASLPAAGTPPVNKVVATISGFNTPVGLAISSDGERVYVANQGNETVSIIDTASNQITATLMNAGKQPWGVALTSKGGKLFVSDTGYVGSKYNSGSVTTLDIKTSTSTSVNTNGPDPEAMALTPDEKHLWIADENGDRVDILDVATGELSPYPLTVGFPESIAFSPNGKKAYVTSLGSLFFVFDTATGKNERRILMPSTDGTYGICLSRNGKTAYVLNAGFVYNNTTPSVVVIDTTTNKVTANVDVPATAGVQEGGFRMGLTPDGNYLYVPVEEPGFFGSGPGSVVMVSTETNSVVGHPVTLGDGSHPEVAIAPDGKHAYVTNESASTVTVIEISE
jgi:YVTN family beta-propeller protein